MRRVLGAGVAVLLAVAAFAPAAFGAREVGAPCTANDTVGATLLASATPIGPADPVLAGERFGVITAWKVEVGPGLPALEQHLQIFLPFPGEGEFARVPLSATETLRPGLNSFATRLPVGHEYVVGLYGPGGTLACENQPGAVSSVYEGETPQQPVRFTTVSGLGVPVTVIVEPDADMDGYGDETQDRCPAHHLYQGACPVARVSVADVEKTRRAILVRVRSSSHASLRAVGRVSWGGHAVRFGGGETKHVTVRHDVLFRLLLPKAVRRHLAELPPRQALQAHLRVRSTDLGGRVKERPFTVRLPGRRKAR